MKSKHLSFDDRLNIEKGLKEGRSFREIASRIDKSLSTVSREVKLHRYPKERNLFNNPNICNITYQKGFYIVFTKFYLHQKSCS